MKKGTHPDYVECTVVCSCGNTFVTRATKPKLRIELCNECHPFYTGQQKFVDTGGRVQRFADKFGSASTVVVEREDSKRKARQQAAAEAESAARAAREEKAAKKAEKAARFAEKAAKAASSEKPVDAASAALITEIDEDLDGITKGATDEVATDEVATEEAPTEEAPASEAATEEAPADEI